MLFIFMGSVYGLTTPIFEASDERWHYPYVRHLAMGYGLPIQDPASPGDWRHEGSQPPLFYLIGAAATSWIDTSDFDEVRRENPHARIGIPGSQGNKNMFVHTEKEAFPYRGTVLSVHVVRLISLLFGAGSVAVTYLLTLEVYPGRRYLAATAALLHALNPTFLFISASVSNDAVVVFLTSLSLWMVVRMVKHGTTDLRCIGLGIVVGLGALTKLSALPLTGVALVALAYNAYKRRSKSGFIRSSLLVFAPIGLTAGWWYLRNWSLYGDPLGLTVLFDIVGRRDVPAGLGDLLGELEGLWISYWSMFGGFNIASPAVVYWVFAGLTAVGVVGLIWEVYSGRRTMADRHPKYLGLFALWVVLLAIALIRFTQATTGSNGRLLFPAISVLSIFLAVGWHGLLGRRFSRWIAWGGGALLGGIAFITPFAVIAPSFPAPAPIPSEAVESIQHPLQLNFGDLARLRGYELQGRVLNPGDLVRLTLYWEALAEAPVDYSVFVHLLDERDLIIAQHDSYPGEGSVLTSEWQSGTVIRDLHRYRLPATAPAPCECRLFVGLYDFETMQRVALRDPASSDSAEIGMIHIPSRVSSDGVPNPVHFSFGNLLALVGYQIDRRMVRPGETISLALYWQGRTFIPDRYKVFVHLEHDLGGRYAQEDSEPQGGAAPTSGWQPGVVIHDRYSLLVAPDAPEGSYTLKVGVYHADTGQRLRVDGSTQGIILSKVRVVPA